MCRAMRAATTAARAVDAGRRIDYGSSAASLAEPMDALVALLDMSGSRVVDRLWDCLKALVRLMR